MSIERNRLLGVPYKRNADVREVEEVGTPMCEANCRRIAQEFYYRYGNILLLPDQIMSAEAYLKDGKFVAKTHEGLPLSFYYEELLPGDLIFAETRFTKRGGEYRRKFDPVEEQEEWAKRLHLAIFLGTPSQIRNNFPLLLFEVDTDEMLPFVPLLLHGTNFEGKSCLWPVDKMHSNYRLVGARQIIPYVMLPMMSNKIES